MANDRRATTATARTRVLPETELLNDLDLQEDLEHARTFGWRARKAGEELSKMGPVVSALGERIHRLAEDVKEVVAFLQGRSYYEVSLSRELVLAKSERQAIEIVGEEAACGWSSVETEVQRRPWTGED